MLRAQSHKRTALNPSCLFHKTLLHKETQNKISKLNGLYKDIHTLLILGCVETNPGPSQCKLKVSHININSITSPGRLDELKLFVDEQNIDILALSETKLDDTVNEALFKLPNFHEPVTKHRSRHGGGVAIYTRNYISTRRIPELECPEEEWIWTRTKINNETILTCALYLPPNLTQDRLDNFIDNLTDCITVAQRYSPDTIIILGDFNAGNIYLDDNVTDRGTSSFDIRLKDAMETLYMTQLIRTPTRQTDTSSNLLDLIFTNNHQLTTRSGILPSFSNIDHFPIFVDLDIERQQTMKPQERHIWDYTRTDINRLTNTLINTDWSFIDDNNIDDATEIFTETILAAAADAIPIKPVKSNRNDKAWVTPELKSNMRKRDRLFRLARQRQTTNDWLKWRQQRSKTTALNRRLKNEHIQKHVNKLLQYKYDP